MILKNIPPDCTSAPTCQVMLSSITGKLYDLSGNIYLKKIYPSYEIPCEYKGCSFTIDNSTPLFPLIQYFSNVDGHNIIRLHGLNQFSKSLQALIKDVVLNINLPLPDTGSPDPVKMLRILSIAYSKYQIETESIASTRSKLKMLKNGIWTHPTFQDLAFSNMEI